MEDAKAEAAATEAAEAEAQKAAMERIVVESHVALPRGQRRQPASPRGGAARGRAGRRATDVESGRRGVAGSPRGPSRRGGRQSAAYLCVGIVETPRVKSGDCGRVGVPASSIYYTNEKRQIFAEIRPHTHTASSAVVRTKYVPPHRMKNFVLTHRTAVPVDQR